MSPIRIRAPALLICALVLLAGSPAAAQEQPVLLEDLEVALWPEYDQPAVLVIYRFQLPPATALPATVVLPIPAQVGAPHAAAWQAPDGALLTADYQRRVEGAWASIAIEVNSLVGQLEYYAELSIQGGRRSFEFNWPGGVALSGFSYEVQQPINAQGLQVIPLPTGQTTVQDGITYLRGSLQPQGEGWTANISVTYQKPDSLLTIEALQPGEALGQPEAPASTLELQALLPWLIIALGLTMVGGGVIWYLRSPRSPTPARIRQPGGGQRKTQEVEVSPLYCHQCGTKAAASDAYCRQCGAKLRRG